MRSNRNCSAQSIMQLELFPDTRLLRSSKKQSKIFTNFNPLPKVSERQKQTKDLLERCLAFGHCSSISVLTALCCLYEEVETYSSEQFEIDIQPYL